MSGTPGSSDEARAPAKPAAQHGALRGVLRIVVLYALFASLWIFGSDWLLARLVADPGAMARLGLLKGWAFVVVSALLLYGAMRRLVARPAPSLPAGRDWLPFAGLALVVALLVAGGIAATYEQALRREGDRIESIAALKVQDAEAWFRHRGNEARFLASSHFFADLFRRAVEGDSQAMASMLERLSEYASSNEYQGYSVHLADGRLLGGDGLAAESEVPELAKGIRAAAASGQTAVTYGISAKRVVPVMHFVAPLRHSGSPVAGVVALRVDLRDSLLKSLETWPVPGQRGDVLLVRREGDALLGMRGANPIRTPRPVSTRELLAAKVIRGDAPAGKAILAKDFRGEPVLGVAAPVPGTDWILTARIAERDAYADARNDLPWIIALGLVVLFAAGIALRLLGERAAFQARVEATQLLENIADASPDAIFAKDLEGRYTLVNREVERLLGRTRAQLLGQDDRAVFPPAEAEAIMARERELVAAGQPRTFEETVSTTDGMTTYLSTKGPLRDAAGRVVGTFGIARDITARKAAEDQLRKLSLAVEQSPSSVVITDLDGNIEYVNAAFTRISGWRAEDAIGRNPRILKSGLTHPSVYESLWSTISRGEVWKGDLVNQRRDGEVYHELAHIAPIRGPDGRITHYVALKDDVTEHMRLAEELEQHRYHLQELVAQRTRELEGARAAAESASRAKSAFLANMSHEIRTPMNAILGLAHLLRRDSIQPVQRERLAKLSEAAQHLLQILNDILDLSKVESGKLQLEVSAFELPDLLERTCGLVEEAARAKGIVVSSEPPASPRVVRGDRTRLAQALLNLVGNAVKFTERGSVRVRCEVIEQAEARVRLRFSVVDTGVGVPEEARERLFLAFEQADTSTTRRFGGTGLGLAITRRLAQLMGGDAGLECTSSAGSTFWFTALVEPTDELQQPATPASPQAADDAVRGPRRILLAEDDPVNQEVATELLESEGYVVTVVDTGAEAVARATDEAFDLILMDVQMPQMDGLEATREIRRLPAHAKTPIVAMTANAFSEDREACLAAGMDAHVAKPVDAKVLAATLRRWLGGSDAPEAEPAAVGAAPADKVAALGALRELESLLAASDFRAGAMFSTHESGLAAADAARAAALGASLRRFDYEQSLQVARAWREALEKEVA